MLANLPSGFPLSRALKFFWSVRLAGARRQEGQAEFASPVTQARPCPERWKRDSECPSRACSRDRALALDTCPNSPRAPSHMLCHMCCLSRLADSFNAGFLDGMEDVDWDTPQPHKASRHEQFSKKEPQPSNPTGPSGILERETDQIPFGPSEVLIFCQHQNCMDLLEAAGWFGRDFLWAEVSERYRWASLCECGSLPALL